MARAGLDMAEAGARDIQAGNPFEGIAQMLLGPAAYLTSPINALVPYEQAENPAIPEEIRPAARGIMEALGNFTPGPDLPTGAMLGGVAAKNKGMLQKLPQFYKDMAEGATDNELVKQHGWFIDKDLQPKFEFSDQWAKFTPDAQEIIKAVQNSTDPSFAMIAPLGQVVDHASYFNNFPQFRSTPVKFGQDLMGADGWYQPDPLGGPGEIAVRTGAKYNPRASEDILSTALHEMSHNVSDAHEGWAVGGSPNMIDNRIALMQGETPELIGMYSELTDTWQKLANRLRAVRLAFQRTRLAKGLPVDYSDPAFVGISDVMTSARTLAHNPKAKAALADLEVGLRLLSPELRAEIAPVLQKQLAVTEDILDIPHYNESFNLYENLLDEANARTIQGRQFLTQEQRLQNPFYEERNLLVPHDFLMPKFNAYSLKDSRSARKLQLNERYK